MSALKKLETICDEIFERWDKDQRSGKLLTALAGRIAYRADVDDVRAALRGAVPIADWKIVAEEFVLIYVVHPNAEFETDEKRRKQEWEGWHVARWITFNRGGWTYHGMMGTVTHVAPLPSAPETTVVEPRAEKLTPQSEQRGSPK